MFQTGIGLIVNKGVKSESLPGLARMQARIDLPCLALPADDGCTCRDAAAAQVSQHQLSGMRGGLAAAFLSLDILLGSSGSVTGFLVPQAHPSPSVTAWRGTYGPEPSDHWVTWAGPQNSAGGEPPQPPPSLESIFGKGKGERMLSRWRIATVAHQHACCPVRETCQGEAEEEGEQIQAAQSCA